MNICSNCRFFKPSKQEYALKHGSCGIDMPPWLPGLWGSNRAVNRTQSCDLHQPPHPEVPALERASKDPAVENEEAAA